MHQIAWLGAGPRSTWLWQELVGARRRDDRFTRPTEREPVALALIADGLSNRSIADRLGITTETLEG